jgi:hypothetical protein
MRYPITISLCALAFLSTAQQRRGDVSRPLPNAKNETISLPEVSVFPPPHSFTNRFIAPPLPGININDTTYVVNSSEENVLIYSSGTELTIPKNAFVKDSEQYDGEVKIFYREFRNPVDIMLSGIPMNNVEKADTNLFQSAGMYEIWAFSNTNEKLSLRENAQINIAFMPTNFSEDAQYKFYSLDTSSGNWGQASTTIDLASRQRAPQLTRAVSEYIMLLRMGSTRTSDEMAFNDRFYSQDYVGIINKKNYVFSADGKNFSYLIGGDKFKMRSSYRVKSVRLNKKGELLFKMSDMKNPADVRSNFGGESVYMLNNYVLKYIGGPLTKSEFCKRYQHQNFSDFRLVYDGSSLVMTLKHMNGLTELPFEIVAYNKKDRAYEELETLEQNIARVYRNRLSSRSRVHDRKHARHKNSYDYDYIRLAGTKFTKKEAYEKSQKYPKVYDQYRKNDDRLLIY